MDYYSVSKYSHCSLGSWHDASLAKPIVDHLLQPDSVPQGYFVIIDSGFPRTGTHADRLLCRLSQKQLSKLTLAERSLAQRQNKMITRLRQASEWGNNSFKSCFRRFALPLHWKSEKRKALLDTAALLHNLRVTTVGFNEIRSVYMPIWERYGQDDDGQEQDRVSAYYAQ
jgi:DDE superfamily endonuclease